MGVRLHLVFNACLAFQYYKANLERMYLRLAPSMARRLVCGVNRRGDEVVNYRDFELVSNGGRRHVAGLHAVNESAR